MTPTSNFVLEDLIYIPMGNYVEMYNRPYRIHSTKDALDRISIRMEDTKSGKATPNILNGITNEIIQPSQEPYNTIINRDWITTKKYIFMLKVRYLDAIGNDNIYYIQGYTEYDGITANGHIDNNLVHYINSIKETNYIQISTPIGIQVKERLTYIYNVINNSSQNYLFLQRPTDIYRVAEAKKSENFLNNIGNGYITSINNTECTLNPYSNLSKTSKISNNITSEYLSEILNIGFNMHKEVEFIDSLSSVSFNGDPFLNAYSTYEKSLQDNRFIMALKLIEGYKIATNNFRFSSLMAIDPTIYNRFKVLNITKDYVNPIMSSTPEVGDFWYGQDPVTLKAYSLIENAVALATRYGFSKIFFTASNMTNPTGEATVFITNFNSFINLPEEEFNFLLEIFKEKFITEILINETFENKVNIHADFYIDILGTSKIYLQFSTYQPNWYTIPTFANSNFNPVVTIDNRMLQDNAFLLSNAAEIILKEQNKFNQPFTVNPSYY